MKVIDGMVLIFHVWKSYMRDYVLYHYSLLFTLLIIQFQKSFRKMACDDDIFPLECLICFCPQMTLDDLDEHVFENHTSMWRRFHDDFEFMPEFRRCGECDLVGVDYTFCDLGDIMYHIQVVHPYVKRDVSERLIRYLWET
jgi:hypothetical protein